MSLFQKRSVWLALFGTLVFLNAVASSDEPRAQTAERSATLRLESPSLPAPLWGAGKVNVVIEASAVEPIGDGRRLLVAHDKNPALFVLETETGRILGDPISSPHFPQLNGSGPKWEGMARDTEGNLYLIGAHNGKTDEERATKSVLIRFRLKDGDSPAIDDASIIRWDISRSLETVLKSEGLAAEEVAKRKVEGLTIRDGKNADGSLHRELLIGLRAPTDKVRVFAADITSAPSPDAELELKPAFAFTADAREGQVSELTSLEYAPALAGFLVITASEDESNVFHGNTLWFVPDGEAGRAQKVATFEVAMKAEGLAILGVQHDAARTLVKLLITYDNDPHATKIPSRFQTVTLVRDPR
jgi:hypothetical protein